MGTLDRSKQAVDYVRSFVRNSPWISIAVLLHVLLIAVLSVVYIATKEIERETPPATIVATNKPLELPAPIEIPPELINRNSVPVLPEEDAGIVNPDEKYIAHAAPGRPGEITDETDLSKEAGHDNPNPDALSDLPSGEPGGTAIGLGEVGHFGAGKPSAYVTRVAGPGGKGKGGPGQDGGGGPGGRDQPDKQIVLAALQWLKNHQSPDGRWDCDGFTAQCKKNTCSGPGYSSHDIGVTGLALLCFLGAGETHENGSFRSTVRNGLRFLTESQDEEGCYGERVGHQFLYDHACAALAMSEAYGMTGARQYRDSAQKAINFILRAQNPYRAWRYAYPPDGDNDTSVTGWMVMVLKSAKLSKLVIDEGAIQSALNWIDEMTDPATGRTGYVDRGGPPSRLKELMDKFPSDKSEAMTAVGVLCRIFAGHTGEQDKLIQAGVNLIAAKLPKWDADSGEVDFYYWYYATLAMFQVGGPEWDRWNKAMKTAIIDHQRMRMDEDEYGSWDPIDAWSDAGGRIYSTALNCLCMEVYYRYPRVFGKK